MTGDVVLFGDAVTEVIAALTAKLDGRSEAYAQNVTVSDVQDGSAPHIAVAHNGTTGGTWPITEHVTIRVVVWHDTDLEAHDLAQLARALLLGGVTGDHLAACFSLTGPTPAVDPDNGQPMSAFTVRAVMRGR